MSFLSWFKPNYVVVTPPSYTKDGFVYEKGMTLHSVLVNFSGKRELERYHIKTYHDTWLGWDGYHKETVVYYGKDVKIGCTVDQMYCKVANAKSEIERSYRLAIEEAETTLAKLKEYQAEFNESRS